MPSFRTAIVKLIPAKVVRLGKYLSSILSPTVPAVSRFTGEATAFLRSKITKDQINDFLSASASTSRKGAKRSATFIQNFITGVRNFVQDNVDRIKRRNDRLIDPTKLFEQALEKAVDSARHDIQSLAKNLMAGKMTVTQFREALVARIRRLHLESMMLGLQGINNVTPNVPEVTNRRISQQIRFIDEAIANVVRGDTGREALSSRFMGLANQYANAGKVTAQQVQRQALSDFSQANDQQMWEMRELGANENNCPSCPQLSGFWARIGTLPAIGQGTECGSNCNCRFIYYMGNEPPDDVGS